MDCSVGRRDTTLYTYLNQESTSGFRKVTWNKIRSKHDERHGYISRIDKRHPTFFNALWFDYYAKRYLSPSNNECTNAFLLVVTFVFAPLYVISRMFNITLVVMVPLFLWTEGTDIFWKMDLFQVSVNVCSWEWMNSPRERG